MLRAVGAKPYQVWGRGGRARRTKTQSSRRGSGRSSPKALVLSLTRKGPQGISARHRAGGPCFLGGALSQNPLFLVSRPLRAPPFSGLDLGLSGGAPGRLSGLENESPGRPGQARWGRNEAPRTSKSCFWSSGLGFQEQNVVLTHLSLCFAKRSRDEARPSPRTTRDTLR